MRIFLVVGLLALAGGPWAKSEQDGANAVFRQGDRWVAVGDSITHTGLYPRFIELFLLTRFPSQQLKMVNVGIGGDTAAGALRRFDWDILAEKPTVVSVMFGMNDVNRSLYLGAEAENRRNPERSKRIAAYSANLRQIVEKMHSQGIRVILVTPSPTDDTRAGVPPVQWQVNEGLAQCAAIVRSLGKEFRLPTVDFHASMRALNERRQKDDPSATLIGPDRIHPGPVGHLVMTHLFLQEIFGKSSVSSVVIDPENPNSVQVRNAALNNLEAGFEAVRFSLKGKALPFPVPESASAALDVVPFNDDFNTELIRITGFPPGAYELRINGGKVGVFSSQEWNAGINLATKETPQRQQARRVAEILARKHAIDVVLCDIAFCELRFWAPRPHPIDPVEMAKMLERGIAEENALASPRMSVLTRYRNYAENKAKESELRMHREELAALAAETARPVANHYEIVRVSEKPTPP
jgi:lysophospholipase L1-like esterase